MLRQRCSRAFLINLSIILLIVAIVSMGCFVSPSSQLTPTPTPPPKSIRLRGSVRDINNGLGIHWAKVTLESPNDKFVAFTDAEGGYRFIINTDQDQLPCLIRVEAPGYQNYDRFTTLWAHNPGIEDIRLIPNTQPEPPVPALSPTPTPASTPAVLEPGLTPEILIPSSTPAIPEPPPPTSTPTSTPAIPEPPPPTSTPTSTPTIPQPTPSPSPQPSKTPTPASQPSSTPPPPGGLFENFETGNGSWKVGDQKNGTLGPSSNEVSSGNFSGRIDYSFKNPGNDFVVFLRSYPLGGEPTGIKADVFGDSSGHYLNVWLKDAQGEVWQFTFGKIQHTGWQPMTAWLDLTPGWPNESTGNGPQNGIIDYPISFHALVLDDAPDHNSGNGVIYIDNLATTGTPIPPPPEGTPSPNPTRSPDPGPPPPLAGRIAFPVDDGGGHYDIWIADLSQRPDIIPFFVPSLRGARQPNFSRKDGQLLVNGDTVDHGLNIRLYSRNYEFQRMVSESPFDSYPYWAPGGERLVYSREDLSRIFVNCGLERPSNVLQNEQCQRVEEFGVVTTDYSGQLVADMPVWTQDGANFVVRWKMGAPNDGLAIIESSATPRDKNPANPFPNPRLLLRSDTARPTDIWGNTVYFFAYDLSNDWEAYALSLNGGTPVNLSNSPGSSDGLPAVSPDGRWVAFVSDRSGNWAVWAIPAQGGSPEWLFDLPKPNPWAQKDHDWTTERISWGP